VKRDVAHDAIALVEDGENRDALRHRRDAGLAGLSRPGLGRGRLVLLLSPAIAAGERQRCKQWCGDESHAYSGIHGS
jgi:hypothetical protein